MIGIDELAYGLAEPVPTPWVRPLAGLVSAYVIAIGLTWATAGGWAALVVGGAMALAIDRRTVP
jgi:hypothetical protein